MLLAFSVLATVLAAAMATFFWAWRGRSIDDHPLCRKCSFDLTGKPDTSNQCPECGADLAGPKAIRTGHRRRRTGWLITSAVTLLLLLATAATVTTLVVRKTDLYPYKPIWLLGRDLSHVQRAMPAMREINARVLKARPGDTSLDAALNAVADRLLAIQADKNQPWRVEMGDVLEHLRRNSKLDDARWERYAANSATVTFAARPIVRQGGLIPVESNLICRGSSNPYAFQYAVEASAKTADGQEFSKCRFYPQPPQPVGSYESRYPTALYPQAPFKPLRSGPHTIHLEYKLNVMEPPQRAPRSSDVERHHLVSTAGADSISVQIVTPDMGVLQAIRSDALRKQLAQDIGRPTCVINRTHSPEGNPLLWLKVSPVSENLSYKIVIQSSGGEPITTRTLTLSKGKQTNVGYHIPRNELPPGTKFSVLLQPDPEPARQTVHIDSYADIPFRWDGLQVPDDPNPPGTQPTTSPAAPRQRSTPFMNFFNKLFPP